MPFTNGALSPVAPQAAPVPGGPTLGDAPHTPNHLLAIGWQRPFDNHPIVER